jgi:predicted HD superfamily hydrolase involved in NAD metabolism
VVSNKKRGISAGGQVDRACIVAVLRKRLTPKRFRHSLRVASLARSLARQYGVGEDKAYLAGLLHDYAKNLDDSELLRWAAHYQLRLDPILEAFPQLLHGPVGACLIWKKMNLQDEEVLQAISRHTLGCPGMSPLDKIIFLADLIEPGRKFIGVEELRCLVKKDLDLALLEAYDQTIRHLLGRRVPIHPVMIEARNDLLFSRCQ